MDTREKIVEAAQAARIAASGATVVCPIRTEHAWRIDRVLDPFGHHWEIGKPVIAWPPHRA